MAKNELKPQDNRPAYGKGGKYNFPNARMKLIEEDDEKRAFVAKAIANNALSKFGKYLCYECAQAAKAEKEAE